MPPQSAPIHTTVVAEMLREATRQEDEFRGIQIGDKRIKVSQFADDTALFLRGPRDLPPAANAIRRWCKATGMRENYKKREGLAMGRYRRGRRARTLPAGVKWVKEGEYAKVLGSPVGNDLDHDKW